MPICGKTLKSSPEQEGQWPWAWYVSLGMGPYLVCSNDDSRLVRQCQLLFLMHLNRNYLEMFIILFLLKSCSVYLLNMFNLMAVK